jgi:hypothetical protein
MKASAKKSIVFKQDRLMIFSHKITALFVTRGKIHSAVFSSGGKTIGEEKVYGWTPETLTSVLNKIAASGPNRARIVFGEEFSYVIAPKFSQKTRGEFLEEARNAIPDIIEDNWDFRKENDQNFSSQVAVIDHQFFDIVFSSIEKTGFFVEAAEPQSIALARLLPREGLFLFIARGENVLLGAVKNGVVVATHIASPERTIAAFEDFISYVCKKFATRPDKVFVSGGIDTSSDIFSRNNLQAEVFDLNPLLGVAMKKDISGKDPLVMNINLKKNVPSEKKMKQPRQRIAPREKILIALLISAVLIAATLVMVFRH